ncbi:hypothetical protein [Saccharospirillum impatiens]|uniref:hypothetical protein n=1 Tax=Saccharospirillum impatiens TaxID=169438 RepID=UPI00041092B7|nr:hypothetical protein [Saccharospirillum impatiens]
MTFHCAPNRTARDQTASVFCLNSNNANPNLKLSGDKQAEEALLRRIKCHLMTELDQQAQTHLKIYVSLAMPTTLQALVNDVTFYVDDQRHTLRVTDLSGSGLPQENNWLATVCQGPAARGALMATVSLGYT